MKLVLIRVKTRRSYGEFRNKPRKALPFKTNHARENKQMMGIFFKTYEYVWPCNKYERKIVLK